jgi:hypothetical protein
MKKCIILANEDYIDEYYEVSELTDAEKQEINRLIKFKNIFSN